MTVRALVVRVLGFHGVSTLIAGQPLGLTRDPAGGVGGGRNLDLGCEVGLHQGIVAVVADYIPEGGAR